MRWPAELTVLRHAESVANAAFAAAAAAGSAHTGLTGPDADVPLSPAGRAQAEAVGDWLAGLPPGRRPEMVLCSPYRRAAQTWRIAVRRAGWPGPAVRVDARLRDRETGALELLTPAAVRARFPAEERRRRRVGELRYRPPGGESLHDVGRRLHGLLGEVADRYADRRVVLVAHDAVVLMLRQVVEGLSADDLARVMAAGPVANASLTTWVGHGGRLRLRAYNEILAGPDAPG